MRILFLHLSDIHFEKKDDLIEKHISEIASALSPASIGTVDKIFLFVTGDIGFSGKAEQYTCFNVFKRKLIDGQERTCKANFESPLILLPMQIVSSVW